MSRTPSPPRPPALARILVRLVLPAGVRDAVTGDLEERFARDADTDPRAARRRYWKDVLSPSLLRLRREARGMHLPPGERPGALRGDAPMTALLTDMKFALRMIRKAPGFTAVAVLSLALGIGPNTAIFSLVNSILFQEWGVRDPDTLVDVYSRCGDGRHCFTSWRVYELVDEGATDVFQDVAAHTFYVGNIEHEGEGELVLGEMVTGNYFGVMGVPAERGRTFLPEEDATPGTHAVIVLSDRFWRSHYGADPGLVGNTVRLNGRPYTVVGIAPPSYKGRIAPGIGTDFWVPMSMYTHLTPDQKGQGNFMITGRVKPGVPPQRANAAVEAVAARYNADHPDSRGELHLSGVILGDILLQPDTDGQIKAMAALLFVAVGMVLLIACVNLAGFLLARSTDRRKEMAVRVALGASRTAVVRQLLVEAVLLAGMGGALGIVLGQLFARRLGAIHFPIPIPIHLDVVMDGRVLLFTLAVSLVAALLFGLAPAANAVRAPVADTLRGEAGSSGGRSRARARRFLVGAQMAVCTVLLFGAGLFVRNLLRAADQDVGFSTAPAAVVTAETWANQYSDEQQRTFVADVIRQVSAEAGVDGIAATRRLPLDLGTTNEALDVPGVEPPSDANHWRVEETGVTPAYFRVMGISLLEGRGFNDGDVEGSQRVIVVSHAMALRFWPDQSAVGKTVYLGADPDQEAVVVGVADDAKIWSLTEAPRPYFYKPVAQSSGYGTYHFVARGSMPARELAQHVRDAAKNVDRSIVLSRVGTMADHLGYIFFLPRMAAFLLALVGGLALTLGTVGLYGMVSYAAARRTREMGIRLALGADRSRVIALVVRGGLFVVVVGGVVGMALSLLLGAAVRSFLIGADGSDPLALMAAPAVLGAVALAATYLPARRVGRVDPVQALRTE
ncbi:MAG: ADOP family duplicated permease [Gemmatimonadota bacterium]|jgi:predicted permease